MARKSNLMLIGAVLSTVLVACSSNANTTAETIPATVETIPATTTTVVLACDPPEHLDCAWAVLTGANLMGADLTGADLTHAFLSGAVLNYADLTGADLTGADLYDADLYDAILTKTNMPDGWKWGLSNCVRLNSEQTLQTLADCLTQ